MEETIALGRKIADLCLANSLRSTHSIADAMEIARMLLDANAAEYALR